MTVATNPAYADSYSWGYGADSLARGTQASPPAGTDSRWFVRSMKLNLEPGTYTLDTVWASVVYCAATNCDVMRFGIFAGNGTSAELVTLSNGQKYVDITSDLSGADGSQSVEGTLGVDVTIESGTSYWFAVMIHGADGRVSTRPRFYEMDSGEWVLGDFWGGNVAGATMPEDTTDLSYTAAGSGEQAGISLRFTTANRIVYQISSTAYAGSATEIIIPWLDETNYSWWIFAKSAVVADGEALTVDFEYQVQAAGTEGSRTTGVLDMGAADQVTFGGADVALAAAGAEAGDTFDLAWMFDDRVSDAANMFYMNRTTGQGAEGAGDLITISHAAKNDAAGVGSRNQVYTISRPYSLKITGTATIETLQVGVEPLVIMGDSQAVNTTNKLGYYLPDAFTYPRMAWHAAVSGSTVVELNPGLLTPLTQIYKNDTNGLGDLCEMFDSVFIVAGAGINDLNDISTTETSRNNVVLGVLEGIAGILEDIASNQGQSIIIGLPPYSKAGATEQIAKAIQHQYNPGLEGLAVAMRCAYVNPWWAMLSGASGIAIPVFNASYTSDAGLHYGSAGAPIVANKAAEAYETQMVGGWWSRKRRHSRQNGSLFPI